MDELCLTISPKLAGAGAVRIATGLPSAAPVDLSLESVLAADEGFLLLRYRRAGADE